MVSDGTTLYWIDSETNALSSVPVGGGAVTPVLGGTEIQSSFLAVDATSVYAIGAFGGAVPEIAAIPKAGGTTKSFSDGKSSVIAATLYNGTLYWAESAANAASADGADEITLRAATVAGGSSAIIGLFSAARSTAEAQIGVTSTAVYFTAASIPLTVFAIPGVADAGPTDAGAPALFEGCSELLSTTPGDYCVRQDGAIQFVSAAGTYSSLSLTTQAKGATADDDFVYWSDNPLSGGVIMKSTPSGTASTVASEAGLAMAVDSKAVYWATPSGTIRRLAK